MPSSPVQITSLQAQINALRASGAVVPVVADAPLQGAGTSASHLSIRTATSGQSGALSAADWATFNAKQAALALPLSVSNGGTGSSASLAGNRIMVSGASTIAEGAAGTATTVLHGNASGAPTYGAVALASDVSGVLPEVNGGTNQSAFAKGDVLYASAANTLGKLPAAADGTVLTLASGVPSWAAAASGVPAGGVLGQSVVNTGSGTGAWGWPVPNPAQGRRFMQWYLIGAAATRFTASDGIALTHFGTGVETVNPQTTTPGYFEAVPGSASGIITVAGAGATQPWTRPGWRPRARMHIVTSASITVRRWWGSIDDTGLSAVTVPTGSIANATHYVAWGFEPSVSANWILASGDGTNMSGVDSGVTVVANTDYVLDLDFSVAGTLTGRVYAAGSTTPTVVTKGTNLPTTSTNIFATILDTATTGAAINGFTRISALWDSN